MIPQAEAVVTTPELGLSNVLASSMALPASTTSTVGESEQEPSTSSQTQPALVHFFSLALPAQSEVEADKEKEVLISVSGASISVSGADRVCRFPSQRPDGPPLQVSASALHHSAAGGRLWL